MPPWNTRTPDLMCKETSLPEHRQVWLQHSTGTLAARTPVHGVTQAAAKEHCEGHKSIKIGYLTSATASWAF